MSAGYENSPGDSSTVTTGVHVRPSADAEISSLSRVVFDGFEISKKRPSASFTASIAEFGLGSDVAVIGPHVLPPSRDHDSAIAPCRVRARICTSDGECTRIAG